MQREASYESETTATRPLGYWVSMFLKASSSPGEGWGEGYNVRDRVPARLGERPGEGGVKLGVCCAGP